MVSYTNCLLFPQGSDATTCFVEGRGTAYLFSCLGGDWGWVKEVSILSPSYFVAQWSVRMGVTLAYMPGDDLKKIYKKVLQPMPFGILEKVMGSGVLTAWVHSEEVILQPALWRGVAQHTSSPAWEGTGGGSKRSP